MRKSLFIWLLLPVVVLAACSRSYDQPEAPELSITIAFPENFVPETRATVGEIPAESSENVIRDLAIWVFYSSGANAHQKVGSLLVNSPSELPIAGGVRKYALRVDQAFMLERPQVDVFVLVNRASINCTLTENSSWDDVNGALFGGDPYFSPNVPISAVPANGLPMSGVGKALTVGGEEPFLKVPTISVGRAVSKLRFVFCQMTENGNPVDVFNITGISLSGQIGQNEKLLTDQVYSTHTYLTRLFDSSGYVDLNKSWTTGLPEPARNASPGTYLYDGSQTTQEYEDLIDGGISAGVLTQWGLTYLRETDKQLSGTISYTVGTGASMRSKTATFTMDAGDFTRNHSWIIYGYFIGGRLVVQPTVLPWIAGNDRYEYATEGYTELGYEKPWLRYDLDKEAWTWNDTWLVVAYGYEGGSVGKPTHSPMFTLQTINSNELVLQLNNDQFIFVQMTQSLDSGNNPVYAYTKLGQRLEIHPSSNKQDTNFYVVPVNDNVMADPYVKVFLTELHSGGMPPSNIPFNHNLPGDEDHTSILIYNPGRAEYNANISNHKNTSSSVQTTQYWLEEE